VTHADLHTLTQKACAMPRGKRWDFIRATIESDLSAGLILAGRCLAPKSRFEDLARMSLSADASTIRLWVDAIVRGVGVKAATEIYDRLKAAGSEGTEKAEYWLGFHGSS
jgi:hypothetical protein